MTQCFVSCSTMIENWIQSSEEYKPRGALVCYFEDIFQRLFRFLIEFCAQFGLSKWVSVVLRLVDKVRRDFGGRRRVSWKGQSKRKMFVILCCPRVTQNTCFHHEIHAALACLRLIKMFLFVSLSPQEIGPSRVSFSSWPKFLWLVRVCGKNFHVQRPTGRKR